MIGKMDSGGKKNLVMEYYRHIDHSKIQFDFICDSDSQAIPKDEIRSLGGRVYIIPPYQSIIRNMSMIRFLCKKNRYLIIHAYNSTMNIFPMFVAKEAGVPIRISESLSMAHRDDKKTIIKLLLRPFSGLFANRFLACGERCGQWQFGNQKMKSGRVDVFKTVIDTGKNAFDSQLRNKTRKEYGWNNKLVVGFIGRFTAQKNPLFLIRVFNAISKEKPNSILCLIGDGELKEEMFDLIDRFELRKKVCYLGRREDIQKFYNAMDCFVLPSLYEGLPVVGLEAECCGLPMFFSTEVTREANACELGHFIGLDKTPEMWADIIIRKTNENLPKRRSYAEEVMAAGFDSRLETKRLQDYYIDAVKGIV